MAALYPYKLRPAPPRIALLTSDGLALEETGELHELDRLPRGVRVYASWDCVDVLLRAGAGEAFYWDGEPVRWRHRCFNDFGGWERRHTDVTVFRIAFPEQDRQALEGLIAWRDWLAVYGAAPQGSLGSSGMSLLRATLAAPLWTARGELPPIRWTLGGRQELGVTTRTTIAGAHHLDLPAAYARTLGELRYGGVWRQIDSPSFTEAARWGADERPVFAHATVTVPDVRFGPLPRRAKKKPDRRSPMDLLVDDPGATYPTRKTISGTWTWQELEEAGAAGARVKTDRLWVHVTDSETGRPFTAWWAAVQVGRAMQGFAATLAKTSANALWGQFAISDGKRQIVRYRDGQREIWNLAVPGGGAPRSWDLAETITGRVRARLHRMMRTADHRLLSVHTDGGWVLDALEAPDGWLVKDQARRIDVIGPQMLRYWRPQRSEPFHCVAGVPSRLAARTFQAIWDG